jgi:hypothetical protein
VINALAYDIDSTFENIQYCPNLKNFEDFEQDYYSVLFYNLDFEKFDKNYLVLTDQLNKKQCGMFGGPERAFGCDDIQE